MLVFCLFISIPAWEKVRMLVFCLFRNIPAQYPQSGHNYPFAYPVVSRVFSSLCDPYLHRIHVTELAYTHYSQLVSWNTNQERLVINARRATHPANHSFVCHILKYKQPDNSSSRVCHHYNRTLCNPAADKPVVLVCWWEKKKCTGNQVYCGIWTAGIASTFSLLIASSKLSDLSNYFYYFTALQRILCFTFYLWYMTTQTCLIHAS